jgi:hypothetical protein
LIRALKIKDAGFADERIIVAMNDSDAQVGFLADTRVNVAVSEEILSLPELDAGQVLIMVDAPDLAAMVLEIEIINRDHGVTGGIRMPGYRSFAAEKTGKMRTAFGAKTRPRAFHRFSQDSKRIGINGRAV